MEKGGGEGGTSEDEVPWYPGESVRVVHAGNLSALPSGRALVITPGAYGEQWLGRTHGSRARARQRVRVCVHATGHGGTLYQVPSMRRYKLSGYPLRAPARLYRGKPVGRYLKSGFLYGFSYLPESSPSSPRPITGRTFFERPWSGERTRMLSLPTSSLFLYRVAR